MVRERPTTKKKPSASRRARSPVHNQPSFRIWSVSSAPPNSPADVISAGNQVADDVSADLATLIINHAQFDACDSHADRVGLIGKTIGRQVRQAGGRLGLTVHYIEPRRCKYAVRPLADLGCQGAASLRHVTQVR